MKEQIANIVVAFMTGEEDAQDKLLEFTDKLSGQIPGFIDAALPVLEAIFLSDGVHELLAKSNRKQYDALVAEGFTEDQAIEIMVQTKTLFVQAAKR